MQRLTSVVLAMACAAGLAQARRWVPLAGGWPEGAAEFRVVSSNSQRTVVELEVGGVFVEDIEVDGQRWQTVELGIDAGALTTEVGSPQLPLVARFLKIPDDRAVTVRVLEREETVLSGFRVLPAQPPLAENEAEGPLVVSEERYARSEFYPGSDLRVSEPMIMRDLRLVQLVLQPVKHNPVTGELRVSQRVVVELSYRDPGTVNVKHRRRAGVSRAFEPLYRQLVANYDFGPPQRPQDGSYLIITHDNFASAVQPFAEWKRRKGWRTVVKTTSDIGGTDSAHIEACVRDAYDNWPFPPDYVLLVGDAPGYLRCCYYSGNTHASDLPYSCKEGSDILADLMIGRVCVTTETEAQTALNKLYRYEMEPYMAGGDWFNKAASLAGYESGPRFWSVCIRVRNYVMGRPFGQFDTLFQRWGLNTKQALIDTINQGRSWFMYRGHGMVNGWDNVSPQFYVSDVYQLNNSGMTPLIVGPTCLAGDFDNAQECLAEAWVKAGTPTEAKGGVGYFGSSEVSYSGYNDSLAAGTWFAYTDSLLFTFAQSTQWGKLFMLMAYPLPDNISEKEIWMFNNIGEPELNPWSDVPASLDVSHPGTVVIGSFPFPVTVSSTDGPVENALVCVMSAQDSTVYHVGYTDAAGEVQFTLNTTIAGDSLLVTVTGRNLHPYLASVMTITPNAAYITYFDHVAEDSAGGNNDGIINPGEVIRLPVWVKNWGSVTANAVTAVLRTADPSVNLTDSTESFGNVAPGDSARCLGAGFEFGVAHACTNGYRLGFEFECRDANDSSWTSNLTLWVGTAVLSYAGQDVDDRPPGGNGDGKIDPGETAQLRVTLHNAGLGNGYGVEAVLRSGNPLFTVLDSLGAFGDIPSDTSGDNNADPFQVEADVSLPRETVIPCTLVVTEAGGFNAVLPFEVVVGEVRQIDPIPDTGGAQVTYWAYEDADSGYTQAPEFNWVEISGVGTRLTLSDDQTVQVSLGAFGPFVFYGQSYSQLSVCGNGFVCPGSQTYSGYSNQALPYSTAPGMLALNWDDLYPPTGGGVWWFHDAANHRFIVEWDSVAYYSPRETRDKFQLVVYDTTLAGPDGNSKFVYQYLTSNLNSSCTVGEQDHTKTVSIQTLFNGTYHRGASPMAAGRAILFTTEEPQTGVSEPRTGPAGIPARLALEAYPNPFLRAAAIRWQLPIPGRARLAVYDVGGRLVRTLVDGEHEAGRYTARWDGRDNAGRQVANGTYLYKLETAAGLKTTKSVLLR